MKSAFTLIELLVVIVVIALVMGMVMPMGSKMLQSFTSFTDDARDYNSFSDKQFYAFISAKDDSSVYLDVNYTISSKGVILEVSTSNDDY